MPSNRRIEYDVRVNDETRRGLSRSQRSISGAFRNVQNSAQGLGNRINQVFGSIGQHFNGMGRAGSALGQVFSRIGQSFAGLGTQVAGLGTAVGVLTIAIGTLVAIALALAAAITLVTVAVGKFVKSQSKLAAELGNNARLTGMSTTEYQKMAYVLGSVGVEMDTMKDAMDGLTGKIYAASTGSKDTQAAFDALGLSIFNTNGTVKTSKQMIDEVVPALQKMSDVGQRNALADELMGDAGTRLIPVLNLQAEEYKNLKKESADYVPISEHMVELSEKQRKAQLQLSLSFKKLLSRSAEKLMVAFTKATEALNDVVISLQPRVERIATEFQTLFNILGDTLVIDVAIFLFDKFAASLEFIIEVLVRFASISAISFNGYIQGIKIAVTEMQVWGRKALGWLFDLLSKVPGVGDVFDDLAVSIRKPLDELNTKLKEQTEELEKTAKTLDELWNTPLGQGLGTSKPSGPPRTPRTPTPTPTPPGATPTGGSSEAMLKLIDVLNKLDNSISSSTNKFIEFGKTSNIVVDINNRITTAKDSMNKFMTQIKGANGAVGEGVKNWLEFLKVSKGMSIVESTVQSLTDKIKSFSIEGGSDLRGLLWNLDVAKSAFGGLDNTVNQIVSNLKKRMNELESVLPEDQFNLLSKQFDAWIKIFLPKIRKEINTLPIDKVRDLTDAFTAPPVDPIKSSIEKIKDEYISLAEMLMVLREKDLISQEEYDKRTTNIAAETEKRLAEIDRSIMLNKVAAASDGASTTASIISKSLHDTANTIKSSLDSIDVDIGRSIGVYALITNLAILNDHFVNSVEGISENLMSLSESFPEGGISSVLFGGEGAESFSELLGVTQEAINAMFGAMGEIASVSAEKRIASLDKEEEAIKRRFDVEKAELSGSRRTRRFYQRDLANLEKQRLAKEAEIAAEREKIQKEQAKKQLGLQLVQSIASTALGVANALTMSPPPLAIAMAAIIGVMGTAQIGLIASQMSKFATGGIVQGPEIGDQNMVRANGGEMILTKQQQRTLFDMANGERGSGSTVHADLSVTVNGNIDDDMLNVVKENQNSRMLELKDMLEELKFRGELSPIVEGL